MKEQHKKPFSRGVIAIGALALLTALILGWALGERAEDRAREEYNEQINELDAHADALFDDMSVLNADYWRVVDENGALQTKVAELENREPVLRNNSAMLSAIDYAAQKVWLEQELAEARAESAYDERCFNITGLERCFKVRKEGFLVFAGGSGGGVVS